MSNNLPKKFNLSVAQEDIKARILYSNQVPDGIPERLADLLGIKKRTVYDILDGKIKMSLDFLHALVIASDGDPELRKYLEPDGWSLTKSKCPKPDQGTLADECLNVLPSLVGLFTILNNPKSNKTMVKKAVSYTHLTLPTN